MAAVEHAISQFKRGGDVTTFTFHGYNYSPYTHNFNAGKLFIKRSRTNVALSEYNRANSDITALVTPDSIVVSIDGKIIDKKCKNASVSFKLDNMYLNSENLQNLGECISPQYMAYSSLDVVYKNDTFVKRHSYNMMFIIETNACIKKIPLLISIQYEALP
jgi:hypothetical protein